jgi:hypothetical protein
MINKLLCFDCIYCISDQNTEKHKQSWIQSSRTPTSLIWKLASAGEWGLRKERKWNKQTNNESTKLQQIPIILHGIQSSCNLLQETLSEIFFCYDQTCYPMAATEISQKMKVYSLVLLWVAWQGQGSTGIKS